MNFKKKDSKRSSYYVWFLGAKESKGLRGDQYVTSVLGYFLDAECQLEPSKVTLQVSSKGLKIVQILTVPRKLSKLSASQQTQLFANIHQANSADQQQSVLKTELVKHHIPHNSITWVYQEHDVICLILLLYNPITRCPVHVHAYRCDSMETASTLRHQLQAMINKPENQKKFRDIEARLSAKGLLNVHPVQPSLRPYSDGVGGNQATPSTSKTLNSDGRSTRTENSDGNSDTSDVGLSAYMAKGQATFNYAQPETSQGSRKNKNYFAQQKEHLIESKSKPSKSNSKSKREEEVEQPEPETVALFESLAAELRSKIGNPKMGPLLLPPKDYDGDKKKLAQANASKGSKQFCPLSRSESSGKSSSGIGSDEALSTDNKMKINQRRPLSQYDLSDTHQPQSFIEIDHHSFHDSRHHSSSQMIKANETLFNDQQSYRSDDSFDFHLDDLDLNIEEIEENVILKRSNSLGKSKSTFELHHDRSNSPLNTRQGQRMNNKNSSVNHCKYSSNTHYENYDKKVKSVHDLSKIQVTSQADKYPQVSRQEPYKLSDNLVVGRRKQRWAHSPSANISNNIIEYHHSSGMESAPKSGPNKHRQAFVEKFYFADHHSFSRDKSARPSDHSSRVDISYDGPKSLNYANEYRQTAAVERSVSPFAYSRSKANMVTTHQRVDASQIVPDFAAHRQLSKDHQSSYDMKIERSRQRQQHSSSAQMHKQLNQPNSRYSYALDYDHHFRRNEARLDYIKR